MPDSKQIINSNCSIRIQKNYKIVFDYYANYCNDIYWRKEIMNTIINHNDIIIQDSFLSNKTPIYRWNFSKLSL